MGREFKYLMSDTVDEAAAAIAYLGLDASWTPVSYGAALCGPIDKVFTTAPRNGWSSREVKYIQTTIEPRLRNGAKVFVGTGKAA